MLLAVSGTGLEARTTDSSSRSDSNSVGNLAKPLELAPSVSQAVRGCDHTCFTGFPEDKDDRKCEGFG